MRRANRHKVKNEKPETSTSLARDKEEHDLAYYIHDRVELMHQVFSCLKYKELKAMAPECVQHISIDNLQELCTEELLGISSKRLCAIMDGAETPSDTESSSSPSPENLETISLDSISSDEEILSQGSSKKNKKHKHRRSSKSKSKCKKSKESAGKPPEEADRSRASRAGLTVLELLELQARARAIRAQLQQEQQHKQVSESAAPGSSHHSSDGEVEIKEEPAEVVEISSDEEKPKIEKQQAENPAPQVPQATKAKPLESTMMTKRISDLIITVPQAKPTRKIKLNRTKALIPVPSAEKSISVSSTATFTLESGKNIGVKDKKDKVKKKKKDKKKKVDKDGSDHDEITLQLSDTEKMDLLEDLDRKSFDNVTSMDSDSSSDTDSDSSELDIKIDKEEVVPATVENFTEDKEGSNKIKEVCNEHKEDVAKDSDANKNNALPSSPVKTIVNDPTKSPENIKQVDNENHLNEISIAVKETTNTRTLEKETKNSENCKVVENTVVDTENVVSSNNINIKVIIGDKDRTVMLHTNKGIPETANISKIIDTANENVIEITKTSDIPIQESERDAAVEIKKIRSKETGDTNENTEVKNSEKELSEGELSGKESSEIEAVECKPEVVCISDDEIVKSQKNKKKKKEKKSKKDKKSKKKDFRESADQNFYTDAETGKQTKAVININKPVATDRLDIINREKEIINDKQTHTVNNINEPLTVTDESVVITIDNNAVTDTALSINDLTNKSVSIAIGNEAIDVHANIELETIDLDEVYEILELSDDSSCYEVEGAVLSKEPTAEEIEALSAKIDEIERVDVVTEQEIREHESEIAKVENISWKDRYLDSAKVKKVITTANIFNALRKKNIELKKKIEESKKEMDAKRDLESKIEMERVVEGEEEIKVAEGTIEHYNMLQGSTKYVDPVNDVTKGEEETEQEENDIEVNGVTREMKKDAKTLLKMYKRR